MRLAALMRCRTILDVVCRTTGMGFAAVARVTEDRWIACQVLDHMAFGLMPGGELKVETTICHEIRQNRQPVVIDHVAESALYCAHHTPAFMASRATSPCRSCCPMGASSERSAPSIRARPG